ncbi:MAG: glycosyltransferase family 4 protein [Acidimicrobiales bacterium]
MTAAAASGAAADPPAGGRRRLLVVSPRPPRPDGQGDQRRAAVIVAALAPEWDVSTVSWLPDVETAGWRRWVDRPAALARALVLWARSPLQVAYVQARLPRRLAREISGDGHDQVVFVTTRALPPSAPPGYVVDFVDDLGGAALRRASVTGGLRGAFWRWEGRRLRSLDRRAAARASVAIACSEADAAAVSPAVAVVPLAAATAPLPEEGDDVVFFGNLFYAPNHEAATWICDHLVAPLQRLGVGPGRIVLAGRRPRTALRERAAAVGVRLRADVADLSDVLRGAAVVLAPMELGSGIQNKVLDAVGAGRACVLTPHANAGIGLVDGHSALVRERRPDEFAAAVATLAGDAGLRLRLAREAGRQLSRFRPEAVAAAWRAALR